MFLRFVSYVSLDGRKCPDYNPDRNKKGSDPMRYRPTKEERAYSDVDERILRRYIRQLVEDLSLKELQRILHVINMMKGG